MDDAALVESAREGDRDAFAAIYDRYADSIHGFCHSVLRDRHEAADVTQDTFLMAAERLGQLRDPSKLRAWLFAIARHRALRHGERRARTVLTGEDSEVVSTGPAPDEPVRQEELQRLVWDAADGLSERDRAILDLNLRHGFDGQELADALGVEPSHAYVLVNRLKEQVDRSLGALLVARHGRSDCDGLARLLDDWDGKLSPLLRKRIARHVDSCEVCSDARKKLASPMALLAATPLLAVPPEVREEVLGKLKLVSSSRRSSGWDKSGFPPGIEGPPNRRGGFVAVVAGVAAIVIAALLLAPEYDDGIIARTVDAGREVAIPTVPQTATTLPPVGGAVALPPTAVSGGTTGAATGLGQLPDTGARPGAPFGASGGGGSAGGGDTVPPGPGPTTAPDPTPAPTDGQAPDVSLSAVPGCTVTLVGVVTDASPIESVTVTWANPNGTSASGPMPSMGGGRYQIEVGPYSPAGTVTWFVTATDTHGNSAKVTGPDVDSTRCTRGGP
jgi:RNA polymerase sigma factor (sigma-70 family)